MQCCRHVAREGALPVKRASWQPVLARCCDKAHQPKNAERKQCCDIHRHRCHCHDDHHPAPCFVHHCCIMSRRHHQSLPILCTCYCQLSACCWFIQLLGCMVASPQRPANERPSERPNAERGRSNPSELRPAAGQNAERGTLSPPAASV